MAKKWDIESLRGEGLQAVANSQNYVTAAIRGNGTLPVTITSPDLTANERQLFDWYDMDAGMDLNTLAGDLELFKNATATMKAAVERQREQLGRLVALWEGKGSEAANDFLKKHNSTADAVTDEFGKVSKGLDGLRKALWNIVDLKKQASTMVDGLVTDRTHFDSAVATYKTGMGDKSQADETNATMIGPHVKNNIEGQMLPAFKNAWSASGAAYDTLINGLKEELPPGFTLPPGVFGPDYDSTDDPATIPGGEGKHDDTVGGRGPASNSSGAPYAATGGGMPGAAMPAGPMGNPNGQMFPTGQQQGMDPSQLVSGMTDALTSALSSVGEAASGIVSAITGGISSIPFDLIGQGLDAGGLAGLAEAADMQDDGATGAATDPDTTMAAAKDSAKDSAIEEARAESGATFATDGKPEPDIQLTGGGGIESASTTSPGQTTPGAPSGATPMGTVPPAGGFPAAQPGNPPASSTPHPAQAQQPAAPQHPDPQSSSAPAASPLPSAGPTGAPAQPRAAKAEAGETPCEIAADELPKAGR